MLRHLQRYVIAIRCLGLAPLHYDRTTQRYVANHAPTLAYCLLVNVVYVALMPVTATRLVDAYNACQSFDLLVHINALVVLANILTFIVTMDAVWRWRVRFCRIVNFLVSAIRHDNLVAHAPPAIVALARRRLLTKALLCCTRLCVLILHFYGVGGPMANAQLNNCEGDDDDDDDDDETLVDAADSGWLVRATFLASVLFVLLLLVLIVCVECSIFMALLIVDVCLGVWQHELRAAFGDVKLLRRLAGRREEGGAIGRRRWHGVWQEQLAHVVATIARRQRRLRTLLRAVVAVSQWQLLSILFCAYISLTSMCFNLIVQVEVMEGYNLWPILIDLGMLLAGFCNLLLLFQLCEDIRLRFAHLQQLLFEISMYNEATAPTGQDQRLARELEQLSLELLQNRCQLTVCGFFELRMSTGMQMIKAIVMNFIIIVQIAIRLYD